VGAQASWLLRARGSYDGLAVGIMSDVKRPRATADITIADEVSFALRIDVDFDQLEAVRASQLDRVVHSRS